ncbi:hypothetical protein J32TS6_18880 [Virgibacillus pantothenticus]|nr:hypothetical protein J32TS6_18880 [Virgibacillus pantothenticus]
MERAFKGVWIPKEIWLSNNLTLQEKVFLVEISSLDNDEGCFASNAYFADFFGLSKNRCSEVIKSLKKKNLISIDYIRENGKKNIDKRVIKVLEKSNRGIRKIDRPIRKVEGGYSENCEGNNTLFNNTSNNTKEYIPYAEIIKYLNEKAEKNYKHTASKTKQLIKARWNEGHKLDDFKKVIDICCSNWKGKEFGNGQKGDMYLRPSTLFNGKFNERLNWSMQKSNKPVYEEDGDEGSNGKHPKKFGDVQLFE